MVSEVDGILAHAYTEIVLILVVVEDGLRVAQVLANVAGSDVLILVVVEDGLREKHNFSIWKFRKMS